MFFDARLDIDSHGCMQRTTQHDGRTPWPWKSFVAQAAGLRHHECYECERYRHMRIYLVATSHDRASWSSCNGQLWPNPKSEIRESSHSAGARGEPNAPLAPRIPPSSPLPVFLMPASAASIPVLSATLVALALIIPREPHSPRLPSLRPSTRRLLRAFAARRVGLGLARSQGGTVVR